MYFHFFRVELRWRFEFVQYASEEDLSLKIYATFVDVDRKKTSQFITCDFKSWKETLLSMATSTGKVEYYFEDPARAIPVYLDSIAHNDGSRRLADNSHMFLETGVLIPIRTFMHFKITGSHTRQISDVRKMSHEQFQALGKSFFQNLSNVGKSAFFRLKSCISKRINLWKNNHLLFASPNASLCQYSGAGKSKMAHEITRQGPGLSITLRVSDDDEAYPPANNLCKKLVDLINSRSNLDPGVDLTLKPANDESKVASLLNFFASLTTTYLQELVGTSCSEFKAKNGTESPEEVLARTYPLVGPRYPQSVNQAININFDYPLFPQSFEEMLPYYQKAFLANITAAHQPTNLVLKPSPLTANSRYLNINDIAEYIENLLKSPETYLTKIADIDENTFVSICKALKLSISSFPFVLVIDEAHLLASLSFTPSGSNVTYAGFQILRRALTYLKRGTPLFVLTLGTKSVLLDMNPPDIDSYRGNRATTFMPPMILSGNFDIFSHVKGFSATHFEPTYEALRNPLVFKLLISLGSPLWSSLLFDSVVSTAVIKLKNSTCAKKEDVFVSWMIRIGAMANPKSAETELLVAKRMACLFNLASDLKTMSVFYPPQPILGIAARKIIQDDEGRVEESLFSSLAVNSTILDLNLGELAEGIAFMNALRAIDLSQNVSFSCKNETEYNACLDHICKECPELRELWTTKSFLLEKRITDEEDVEQRVEEGVEQRVEEGVEEASYYDCRDTRVFSDFELASDSKNTDINMSFDDDKEPYEPRLSPRVNFDFNSVYHVTTVREVLLKHYGESISYQLKSFSKVVLDGLVNATHFVKLPSNPSFDANRKAGYSLPVPNNVKGNGTRHYIDRSLLRLGLVRQCGFSMPPDYFGVDGIIPVCLNMLDSDGRPIYTFIAIQVKRGERATTEHAFKMQARLHYINCPYIDSHSTTEPDENCPHCVKSKGLDVIFGNQIALLVSFIDPYFENQAANELQLIGENRPVLAELYNGNRPLHTSSPAVLKVTASAPVSLASPRILHTIRFSESFRIYASLWQDDLVDEGARTNLKIASPERATTIARKFGMLSADGTRQLAIVDRKHRLFCISTDGLERFKHLFGRFPEESLVKTETLLNPTNYFGDSSTIDLPCIVDALLCESILPDYNQTLLEWRGISMNAKNRRKHRQNLLKCASAKIREFKSENLISDPPKN